MNASLSTTKSRVPRKEVFHIMKHTVLETIKNGVTTHKLLGPMGRIRLLHLMVL